MAKRAKKPSTTTGNGKEPELDPRFPDLEPQTELGRRLLELRRKFIDEGGELLDEEAFEREVAERRGGVVYVRKDADTC